MAQIPVGATKNVVLVHGGFVDGSGKACTQYLRMTVTK
jgi:hypothetical protein